MIIGLNRLFLKTKDFLNTLNVPACIVSNIDRSDIESAIAFNGLSFQYIVTSEDARSYKPRTEIFEFALKQLGLNKNEVLHVGDSLSSDVAGANNCGIKVAWLNRNGKNLKNNYSPGFIVHNLTELLPILEEHF